jgi:dTDP-4-amino-4,6-dideoxygalactose transaminase
MTHVATDIAKLSLCSGTLLRHVLQRLNETGSGLVVHVGVDGRFLQTITDGDVRRMLIGGASLDDGIYHVRETPSITGPADMSDDAALALMDHHVIDHLPLVDDDGRATKVLFRRHLSGRIFLSTPHMGDEELQFVQEACASNWIAPLGPNVDAFETEIATATGIAHAAALSSGTAAIHLALILLGVSRGDRVLCSSLTFAASANPIVYQGAEPIFIDSEMRSWNMCPDALVRALEECKREGRLPKAVIIVDLYGQPADYDRLLPICDHYGVPVIEDAAESLGSKLHGQACGSFGTIGVFSFNGNKIITTSGGGMLVAEDPAMVQRARKLATQAREDMAWYEHIELGFNYRMSNVLAGIGRGQLARLDERVAARRAVFDRYRKALAGENSIHWMPEFPESCSNRWLTAATLEDDLDPSQIIADLARVDIEARHLWKPMHQQPFYRNARFVTAGGNRDIAGDIFSSGLCLPSGSNMTESQVDRVADVLLRAINRARSHVGTAR